MKEIEFDKVYVDSVILSSKELRGDGEKSPYRRVNQVFTLEGELIAEYDPYRQSYAEIDRFLNQLTGELALLNNNRATQFEITQKTRFMVLAFFGMTEKDNDFKND